jgi:hypothetical protein
MHENRTSCGIKLTVGGSLAYPLRPFGGRNGYTLELSGEFANWNMGAEQGQDACIGRYWPSHRGGDPELLRLPGQLRRPW